MVRITLVILLILLPNAYAEVPVVWLEPDGIGTGDYANDRIGNSWGMDDSSGFEVHQIDQISIQNGILKGTTTGNDPWISFDLDPLDLPDAYRYGTVGLQFMHSPGGPVGYLLAR